MVGVGQLTLPYRQLCGEGKVAREALDVNDESPSELDLGSGLGLLAGRRDRGRLRGGSLG